jgi:ribonuclease HI
VKFWEDSWHGLPPLSYDNDLRDVIHIIKENWGEFLIDYVLAVERFSGKVIWKDPFILPISYSHKQHLFKVMIERKIFLNNENDVLIWAPSPNGEYSIKAGYKALKLVEQHETKQRAFSFCWNNTVLPKAGCFAWLALRKRILTSDRLQKLNISQPFQCVLCSEDVETVDHLFIHCSFAQQCWNFVMQKLNLSMPLPYTLWDLFQSWPILFSKSFFACIWKCSPALVIWAIWWERNKRIFRNVTNSIDLVLKGLEKSISEVVNAHVKNKISNYSFTQWDNSILKRWNHISIPPFMASSPPNNHVDRSQIKWLPPTNGCIKVNFDGSSRSNSGKAGCGICLRNHLGEVLAFKCLSLPSSTNNTAEAFGLLYGLVLAKNLELKVIHIEGDSNLIINACIKRQIINWRIKYIMSKIWCLIDSFDSCLISHTYREGNSVADLLAKWGSDGINLDSTRLSIHVEDFPDLAHIIDADKELYAAGYECN